MQSDGDAPDVVKHLQLSNSFIVIPVNQNRVPLRKRNTLNPQPN
jgi:hypothetical protein